MHENQVLLHVGICCWYALVCVGLHLYVLVLMSIHENQVLVCIGITLDLKGNYQGKKVQEICYTPK